MDWLVPIVVWKTMLTLTFDRKNKTHPVSKIEADFQFRRLVQVLNVELFGKHYTHKVGHCYFPFIYATEMGSWGLLHAHVLVGDRVNYSLIIDYWKRNCGRLDIEKVNDQVKGVRYVSKYVVKGGSVDVYIPKKISVPKFKPIWYDAELSTKVNKLLDMTSLGNAPD